MRSALLCASIAEKSFEFRDTGASADAPVSLFHGGQKTTPDSPQTARHCSIINNSSADDTQSKAARILNRHAVVRLPAVPCPQTSAPQ